MNATSKDVNAIAVIKNILLPTDFSRQSALALQIALPIARKYGATVHVVHVLREPVGLPVSAREGLHAAGIGNLNDAQDARAGLREIKQQLSGIPSEISTRTGDVWTELSAIIQDKQIDLVVAGTHGRSAFGKLLMGSVAEKVFREAPCPVLTIGPAVSGEPESITDLHEILFATDFSVTSLAALPYAISLAQENDARLYMLHVVEGTPQGSAEELKAQLRLLLPKDSAFLTAPRIFVEHGTPGEKIVALAEELGVDVIVMGVKRKPLMFEASAHLPLATAYKVVRESICPVLTLRG